jgi:Gene product 88
MTTTEKLKFGVGNNKFGKRTTFSLSAGWSCPGARDCMARVDMETGELTDGKHTEFRCFAASMEARMPSVRKSRERNFRLLKECENSKAMAELILASLPETPLVRVHVSGDFFNSSYFKAWMQVAAQRPNTVFYAYTKSLKIWIENRDLVPANFRLNASKGGVWDHLIREHNLKCAEVVFSPEQAQRLGLEIDHDDHLAFTQDKAFALLLHGTQPKGSIAAKALSALKTRGFKGYGKAA